LKSVVLSLVRLSVSISNLHLLFHLLDSLHLGLTHFIDLVSELFLMRWLISGILVLRLVLNRWLCHWELILLSCGQRLKLWGLLFSVRITRIIRYITAKNVEVHSILLDSLFKIRTFFSMFWRVLIMVKWLNFRIKFLISVRRVFIILMGHLAPSSVGSLRLQVVQLWLENLRFIKGRRSHCGKIF
jgi:hypothetical protein